ncbi:MAG: hypothetical protein JRJ20_17550 [Deltaproteobacteria bacterium]|nr:hypothetical protein [Deltaproteobacteria bacterium]
MVGFDWALPIKLLNPRKNFFISGQVFHFYTLDYRDDKDFYTGEDWLVPDSSPYNTWTVPRNQAYGSMLVRTEYLNERVVPSILYVRDFHTQADWCVSEIGFKVGDHWRPKLRWLYIDGPYQESFGLYKDRDEISLRIEYQF